MKKRSWARPHPICRFYGLGICYLVLFTAYVMPLQVLASSIPYRLYTISDGLQHENIQTIEQTPDGRLWVGTSAGLSFYTGTGFVPVRFLDASSTVNILEIVPLGNDDVWVATHQLGIWQVRYQNAVQPFPELANVRASRLIARNDTLFAYGRQHVWRVSLKDETVEQLAYKFDPLEHDAHVAGIVGPDIVSADRASNGSTWILDKNRGPGQLFADGSIRFHDTSADAGWFALRFDNEGIAWVSHEKKGLFKLDPATGAFELVIDEVGVRHICVTPTMIVVTSHNKGALYWSLTQNRLMPPLNEDSGLPTNRVNCMYRDHEGNGWVGTQIGLIHISHPGVKHYMEIEQQPLLNLNAVYNHEDQSLWASSFTQGLFQLHPEQKSVMPMGEDLWTDLFRGQDGRMYALGGSGWFTYAEGQKWTRIQPFEGGEHGDVDRLGRGFFWHANGIYKHEPGQPVRPLYTWPLEEQSFHHQKLGPDGRLIVWANGQLIEVARDDNRNFGNGARTKVIRDVSEFKHITVNDIEVDYLGRTWVALLKNGVLCIEPDTTIQLLPDYHIENLSIEGDSLLIANAREGLFVFNLPPAKNKRKKVRKSPSHLRSDAAVRYHLTQSDGLMSSIVSGAAFTGSHLWVTHPGGVSQVPRTLLTREAPIPQVLLTSINYNGIARSPYRELDLNASDRNIGFEFSATTYSHQHKVQYRYRLKGFNDKWMQTLNPFVHFAKLPAGDYEFEVQAATTPFDFGKAISYDFEIPEPYYQRPAFWMGIIILLTVLVYYMHLYRLRSMLQVERTRTRIAMDLHDDIGSSLTSLSFLSNLAWQRTESETPREEITPLLKEIGTMSSELVDNMLDIVWSVDPKQDSVGSIISRLQAFYQRVHSSSEISIYWHVEEKVKRIALSPGSRRNLYLILKEAINNSIKYSGTRKIEISMSEDLALLHVEVKDYGVGFDVDKIEAGYGLNTMRERAEDSGATFEIRSSVNSATTVYIRWPLRKYVGR